MDNRKTLIDFLTYYKQGFNTFNNQGISKVVDTYLSINGGSDETQAVRQNEQGKEVSFTCKCTWPQCNKLSNCREHISKTAPRN